MEKKLLVAIVLTLFIATAVLPAVGTMNEKMYQISHNLIQPTVEWEKTYGGDEFDHFHTARQTSDGGFIACGLTEVSDMYYAWILKVDSNGNEVWNKTNYNINGSHLTNTEMWITAMDVIEASDNGFLIVGWSDTSFEYEEETYWFATGYLWKTDDEGNTNWVKHYYEINETKQMLIGYAPYNVIEVDDGFIMGGVKEDITPDGSVLYHNGTIFKTDLNGNFLWFNEFDKTQLDYLSSICQTSDGGYYLGGYIDAEGDPEDALRMVKTDGDGKLEWENIFNGPNWEYTYGKGFYQTSDGGYVMNGVTLSYSHGGTDVWLIKADSSGNEVWNKTFGETKNDYSWSMCKADNNGMALGICLNYGIMSGNASDIFIVETDENGNTEWEFHLDKANQQVTRFINQTTDGGYIVAGMTSQNFGAPSSDGILLKLASFDNGQPSKPTIAGKHKGNPNTNYTFTASSSDPDGDTLSYMWDWGDGSYSEWLTTPIASHFWTTKDNFKIRTLVKDEYGYESEWSDPFTFSTPKIRIVNLYSLITKVLECFPLLERILNH